MIIVKESFKSKTILNESTPVSLDDVVGLGGFKGYTISGPKIYVQNLFLPSGGSLVQGPAALSRQFDISLISKGEVIVSFPIRNIKSIGMKRLNVLFVLQDGTTIELLRP
jgi:hypothetical protein